LERRSVIDRVEPDVGGTWRVLLVDDSVSDAKLVAHHLRATGRRIELERIEDAAGMRAALTTRTWDLVICDWSMPTFNAPDALLIMKELGLDIPFIIVSGTVGEAAAVEAMRAGAHDYVLKDNMARLAPAIEREVRECKVRDDRRQVESALKISEFRFKRLAESGIIGIAVADLRGKVHEANDAYLRMIGFSRDELQAGLVDSAVLVAPEWHAADEQALELLRAHGAAPPWESAYLGRDGSCVPVLLGAAMLDPINCITFAADLSERKRAEEALRRSEEQFRQAHKMEAIGGLAAGVAHDFNNLLTVILGYSETIAADLAPSDPILPALGEIRAAGRRAADLTRQLLAFSRQQVLEPRVLNLNDVVTDMQRMLRRLIGEDVELTVLGTSDLDMVNVDPGQINQVLMNLVVNARDAMPSGGKLTIETANVLLDSDYVAQHEGARSGPYVTLSVIDSGLGMTPEIQARIFEPFFTTKEFGKGTGLGLSTVFGIVQQSGGNIEVHSEPGLGTTIKVYLPRSDAPHARHPLTVPSNESCNDGTETILVVEDEEGVRAVVCTILRRHGYRILEAQSGGDALVVCEQHAATIDLMLTDVVMARMSGRQLAERLLPMRPDMKVIYMSGYAGSSIGDRGVLDSSFAFLQKPIMPASLVRKVRDVLDAPAR
jgi:two-component system cell cycle sensor histidine kinase/response regulator CckA